MIMINLTKATTVFIGRQGEHYFRQLNFDVSSMLGDEYIGTSLHAIYKRPDGTIYPVVTTYEDEVLTWSPSATDTLVAGVGRLEIRVVVGDVIGKSVRVLTLVEEAIEDVGGSPPDPPAQEWLNKVLSTLSELDIHEINSLLNLIYGLLNNNYNLLNTTHNLVNVLQILHEHRSGIILNHLHPIETASAPDLISRRGSITFTSISSGDNLVLGSVTYTFVTSLSNPPENNVQVLIQSNLRNNVKKLAEAIRGVEDSSNIAYGTGTNPNPNCTAYWTSQRFSIGAVTVTAGESLFILEKDEDINTPVALTSSAPSVINVLTRAPYVRYVLSGNVPGSGGANSIRGPLHTVIPIGSVVIGGQGGELYPTAYDCHLLTLCRQSDTSEKELDLYISNDEVNFIRLSRSTPVGTDGSNEAQHIHIQMRQNRIPPGYGLYIRMGSDGTQVTAFCDLKFTYHLYPVSLAENN